MEEIQKNLFEHGFDNASPSIKIYPDTIKNPKQFEQSKPANFDGIFNWKWMEGCFGQTKITPTDHDCVVERYKHYLICESKLPHVAIPQGQLIALEGLMSPKSFCVMKIWGKQEPIYFETMFGINGKIYREKGNGVERARDFVKKWFQYASKRQ